MTQPKTPLKTNQLRYDAETVAQIREWTAACRTWDEARQLVAKKLGVLEDNVTRNHRRHGPFWTAPKDGATAADGRVTTHAMPDGSFESEVETSIPKTVDEVVKMLQVDLGKWEPRGFRVTKKKNAFGWNASFAPKKQPDDVKPLLAALERASKQFTTPRKWTYEKPSGGRDCMYVLNLQDVHMAKLVWFPECGDSYDIHIAEKAYRAAVDDLMAKAPAERIEKVVLIVGSDLLQVDTDQSTTTAGTYVDSDSRIAKIFDTTGRMVIDVVERLAPRVQVHIVVIPGNHDSLTSLFLGYYLQAWFRGNRNVTVDNAPKSRKYVPFGKTLVGFDHGDETKLSDLPLLLMRENQATISQFKYQEVLTGHLHQEGVDEYKGIKVRIAPALCPPDKWHVRKGFVGNIAQSQGLLYTKDHGLHSIYYSEPLN